MNRRFPIAAATTAAAALLVGSLQGVAFATPADHHVLPAAYRGRLVAGGKVAPVAVQPAHPALATVPAPALPTAGRFRMSWPSGSGASAPRPVGTSGITVAPARSGSRIPVHAISVEVLDAAAVRQLGLTAPVLRVTRTDGSPASGSVSIRIPGKVLTGLYGADYASRVHWVSLPASATASSLSRSTTRPQAIPATSGADGTAVLTPQVASRAILVTAAATPVSSGGAGTWAATSLHPSGSWSVSTQAGAFTWSYPLGAPTAAAGPAPGLALSYDSGSVDGETASTNNQSSVVGEGWQLAGTGYIERSYAPCAKDGTGLSAEQSASGDLCWSGDNDTMSFGGHSGALVPTGTAGEFRLQDDDGSRVRYLATSSTCSDGGSANGCWQLTTQDGTQYFFGRGATSAWTVPVYGDDSSEPCHAATFAASVCTQAWRWNLDKIVDIHGNSETFSYHTETNYYHRDNGGLVSYVRGGYLTEIDYGIAPGASAASDRVSFGYDKWGRCSASSPSTTTCADETGTTFPAPAKPANYPDVPWDQNCVSGGTCTGLNTPTFWTTQMLDTVTTQALVGSTWTTADAWTLHHQYVSPGDTSAASMWLSGISHPGLSDTTFDPISLNNRVKFDTYLPLAKQRVADIHLDSGAIIAVGYDNSDCTTSMIATLNPASNTHRCFPQWWTPPNGSAMLDWFNSYRVNAVSEVPNTGGPNDPQVLTQYVYTSDPAWRLDLSPATLTAQRTWSIFAGYRSVEVRVGDSNVPAQQQTADYTFFQGLDHDPDGTASQSYRSVSLSAGGHTVTDSRWLAGSTFETIVRNGSSGGTGASTTPVVSDTVSVPWAGGTASSSVSRSFTDPTPGATNPATLTAAIDYGAYLTGAGTGYAGSTLADGTIRTVTTTTSHDSYGRITQVAVSTPDAGSSCTVTSYATDPTGHTDTSLWLLDLPARVATAGSACGTTPSYPADAVKDTRYYYDGASSLTAQALSKGNLTRTDVVRDYNGTGGSAETVTTASTPTAGYDALGRRLQVTDANGTLTTTGYTPAAAGPLTSETVTTASGTSLALATTTAYSPVWEQPTSVTDANGNVTTVTYDSLGRRSQVWLPDRPQASNTVPSIGYSYVDTNSAALEVTTTTPNANGGTISTYAFADGLGRSIQTQSAMDSSTSTGQHVLGGTVLTGTHYDKAGRVVLVDNTYGTSEVTPSATLFAPAASTNPPSQTQTVWDGAGRKTADIALGLNTAKNTFGELWRTSYSYPGTERTDVTPPAGGTPTSTYTDSLGRTTFSDQYLSATPSGAKERTSYGHDARGDLTAMADPAGNHWSWTFDPRGNQTAAVDPDSGTTTSTYDNDNNVLTVVDGAGNQLRYGYDALDRKTAQYEWPTGSTGWAQVAGWTYDTATRGKGLLAAATSFVGSTTTAVGTGYSKTVSSYDADGRPLTTGVVVPHWNGATGNVTFSSTKAYNAAGQLTTYTDPGMGGLPFERPGYIYDNFGNLSEFSGTTEYLNQISYTSINQPSIATFANGNTELDRMYTYDDATNRLTNLIEVATSSSASYTASHTYTYDNAGLLTEDSNLADGQGTDAQCYVYDALQELTEAWTPASHDCGSDRSSSTLGGPAPYWQSYTYNLANGNRTSVTNHASTTGGTSTQAAYSYPAAGSAQPHTVTGVANSSKTAAATTWTAGTTDQYTYNADGQTIARRGQREVWNAEGHLTSSTTVAGSVSNIYDADGNLLLQSDPTAGTTLYLWDTELNVAPGSSTVTATRTYSIDGVPVAERSTTAVAPTTSTVYWLNASPLGQNTADDEVNAVTGATIHRYLDPFGNARGGAAAWSSNHTFLNQANNSNTGTVHLGARDYDAALGRFLSVDPTLVTSSPQQANGYSYSLNDPVNQSDASGLCPKDICGDGGPAGNMSVGYKGDAGGTPSRSSGYVDPPQAPTPRKSGPLARLGGEVHAAGGFVDDVWHGVGKTSPASDSCWDSPGACGSRAFNRWQNIDSGSSDYLDGEIDLNVALLFLPGEGEVAAGEDLYRLSKMLELGKTGAADAGASALERGALKVPDEWGSGLANRKGAGTRWTDPSNPGNGIRIDQGTPGVGGASQQVDHVVVRHGGRILGPDGKPIVGSLSQNPQAHIPLTDWLDWSSWNAP